MRVNGLAFSLGASLWTAPMTRTLRTKRCCPAIVFPRDELLRSDIAAHIYCTCGATPCGEEAKHQQRARARGQHGKRTGGGAGCLITRDAKSVKQSTDNKCEVLIRKPKPSVI